MTPRTQDIQLESNEAYGEVRKYSDIGICVMIILPHADSKAEH